MPTEIKTLREKVAENVAALGPNIEAAVIAARVEAIMKKRIDTVSRAMDILDKLSVEKRKVDRPDTQALFDSEGKEVVPAAYNDKTLKAVKEVQERISKLAMELNQTLASHETNNKQTIDAAYQKLNQTLDKVSRGVKDGPVEDEPVAA